LAQREREKERERERERDPTIRVADIKGDKREEGEGRSTDTLVLSKRQIGGCSVATDQRCHGLYHGQAFLAIVRAIRACLHIVIAVGKDVYPKSP